MEKKKAYFDAGENQRGLRGVPFIVPAALSRPHGTGTGSTRRGDWNFSKKTSQTARNVLINR